MGVAGGVIDVVVVSVALVVVTGGGVTVLVDAGGFGPSLALGPHATNAPPVPITANASP